MPKNEDEERISRERAERERRGLAEASDDEGSFGKPDTPLAKVEIPRSEVVRIVHLHTCTLVHWCHVLTFGVPRPRDGLELLVCSHPDEASSPSEVWNSAVV